MDFSSSSPLNQTQSSTIALAIPEILTVIGSFFYLNVGNVKESRLLNLNANKRKIHSLLACIRVSRLWFRTFHPILWHRYEYNSILDQLSTHSLGTNGKNMRIFTAYVALHCDFNCTQLIELELSKSRLYREKYNISYEQRLVRANPSLRKLFWIGDGNTHLSSTDLTLLECLQELELSKWTYNEMDFFDVLRPMARTLTILSLWDIENIFLRPVTDTLYFPVLETIMINLDYMIFSYPIPPSMLQHLFNICPKLKTLGFKLCQVIDMEELEEFATSLQMRCPELQDLTFRCNGTSSFFYKQSSSYAESLIIKKCSHSGLTRLSILDCSWSESLLLAIMSQSMTLTELHFTWEYGSTDKPDGGAQFIVDVLRECPNLVRIDAIESPWEHRDANLDNWHRNQATWVTHPRLEILCFGFSKHGEKEYLESDFDAELACISNLNPVMGWWVHGKSGVRGTIMDWKQEYKQSGRVIKSLFKLLEGAVRIQQLVIDDVIYTRSHVCPLPLKPYAYAFRAQILS